MATLTQNQADILSSITNGGSANFWQGYTYLQEIFSGNSSVSDFLYWLGKAAEINSDDFDSTANTFIREVTRIGLLYDGADAGAAVQQENSTKIGLKVISDIIRSLQTPTEDYLVSQDVSAAVLGGGQTVGGWGGAFYYWNAAFGTSTVGAQILANPLEYDKFVTAAARATVEVMNRFGVSFEQVWTGLQADAPLFVKAAISERVADFLADSASLAGNPYEIYLSSSASTYIATFADGQVRPVGWKLEDGTSTGTDVSDPTTLALLFQIYDKRISLVVTA